MENAAWAAPLPACTSEPYGAPSVGASSGLIAPASSSQLHITARSGRLVAAHAATWSSVAEKSIGVSTRLPTAACPTDGRRPPGRGFRLPSTAFGAQPLESECPRLWTGSTEELDWFYRKEP